MLWLCLYLPRLSLDARAEPESAPVAVVVNDRGRRRLLACNAAARERGIQEGDDASAAQAIAPALKLLPRAPRAERRALEGVAAWAYRFTDRIAIEARESLPPSDYGTRGQAFCAVLAELSGSVALFDGIDRLCARIAESFAELGYEHRLALAPTPAAAEALARAGDARPVTRLADLGARLAPLELDVLELPGDVRAALRDVGVGTAGDCLALPHDQLARRFGAGTVQYLRRLTGAAPDVRARYVPPQQYRRRFEFAGALESVEALVFPLKRLLLELEGVLIARDSAVLRLTLELEHEPEAGCPRATPVALNLAVPRRDAPPLLGLLRERLERTVVAAPVTGLTLRVDEFAAHPGGQYDLFDDRARRDDSAQQLVERLVARFGADAVRSLALRADFRPEAGCAPAKPFAKKKGSDRISPTAVSGLRQGITKLDLTPFSAARPPWLLHAPRPLAAPPHRVSRPERIETGWWDGDGVARDYYVAETAGGSRLWVFCEQGQWYLHGIWA